MNLTVGAASWVWKENRYLPLVLEQLEVVAEHGPAIIIWNRWPFYWFGKGPVPDAYTDEKMQALLHGYPGRISIYLNETKYYELPDGPKDTVNMGVSILRKLGAEMELLLDTDHLLRLDDVPRIIEAVSSKACFWRTEGTHYWRDFRTAHGVTGVRLGFPTDIRWPFSTEEEETQQTIPGVHTYHPSWVLSDDEVEQKCATWGHAVGFRHFCKEWLSGEADAKQKLTEVAPPPTDIMERLKLHGALDGL